MFLIIVFDVTLYGVFSGASYGKRVAYTVYDENISSDLYMSKKFIGYLRLSYALFWKENGGLSKNRFSAAFVVIFLFFTGQQRHSKPFFSIHA